MQLIGIKGQSFEAEEDKKATDHQEDNGDQTGEDEILATDALLTNGQPAVNNRNAEVSILLSSNSLAIKYPRKIFRLILIKLC